jgi:hypothetical protein
MQNATQAFACKSHPTTPTLFLAAMTSVGPASTRSPVSAWRAVVRAGGLGTTPSPVERLTRAGLGALRMLLSHQGIPEAARLDDMYRAWAGVLGEHARAPSDDAVEFALLTASAMRADSLLSPQTPSVSSLRDSARRHHDLAQEHPLGSPARRAHLQLSLWFEAGAMSHHRALKLRQMIESTLEPVMRLAWAARLARGQT